jgi:hypothetical protein
MESDRDHIPVAALYFTAKRSISNGTGEQSGCCRTGKAMEQRLTQVTEMERRLEEASSLAPQLTAEQRQQLLALGDDLEQLWVHPNSPVTLKKRVLRTVLQEVIADTTGDLPTVHLKLHWADGSHT